MPYLGKTPSQATRQRYYKTASGGETSLSGTMTVGGTLTFNDGEFVDVSVNGVALVAGTDYNTTTANTIGGLSALSANDQVEIVVYDTFSVFGGNVDGDFNLNNGTMTLTRDDNSPQLIIKSTDADASVGPEMELLRDSASPANSDVLGQIQFKGKNDAAETIAYAEIDATISDVADGTEDGELRLQVKRAGTTRTGLSLGATETVFNDAGIDNDLRVESDGNANMLFVDAGNNRVGIGTNSPSEELHVSGQILMEGSSPTLYLKETDTTDTNFQFRVASGELRIQTNNDAFNSSTTVLSVAQAGTTTLQCSAGDSNQALLAYHPTSTSSRAIAKFQSNVGSTQADKVTIGCDGKVTIADGDLVIGTSGHGIDFSATSDAGNSASMGAELLDDYEEGTWTPTAQTDSGNAASLGSVSGLYTKIGRMVFLRASIANINVTGSGVTSSEPLRIGGLPFTCDGSFTLGAAVSDNITLQGSRTQLNSQANTAEYITFTQSGGSQSETTTDHGDIDSTTSDIFFSIHYFSNQ